MLYTSVPLERIYNNRTESLIIPDKRWKDLGNTVQDNEYRCISLPHGNVYVRRNGENFVVDCIQTTDMNDYLNGEYSPGSVIKL